MPGILLDNIHSVTDAAALFETLGYQRDVQVYDDHAWLLARWRGFQVIGCDSPDPAADARSLAARLGTVSQRALCVAVGPGELALAAPRLGTAGSTRARRIPLKAPGRSTLRFLEALRPTAPNALAHTMRIAELLSMESVGERFFVAFRQVLERMMADLGRRGSSADRRTAALLPLTRVLFLYFVQEKGWLDRRADYLRWLLDTTLARRAHFHRSALHPLFFGTLNRRPRDRSGVARLGAVPYLNGGLFEPHPVERRLGPVVFPNHLWRDAFDLVFERFRFCVREGDEDETIAPDMLGHVFERVMDPGDRKDSGTFYTPELVVRQVVDTAIQAALRLRLHHGDVRALMQGGNHRLTDRDQALRVIRDLRILDPAVGSGAFLLGALARLCELHVTIDPALAADRSRVRREILSRNLFGLDLNPLAVRLAELRLWLAVIADDPTEVIAAVTPLPNLDGVVRQGDALYDPIAAARACGAGPAQAPASRSEAVAAARSALFGATGAAFRNASHHLRTQEVSLALGLLRNALASVQHRLRDLAAAATSPDLFGRARKLTPRERDHYKMLLKLRRSLRRSAAAAADGQVPFFSFEVHAPEVMAAGGFTIVVGNPPWVRAERLDPPTRAALQRRFTWWQAPRARGFAHQPDLSVAFLQRSFELVAPDGVVALLVPSKVTSAGYGEAMRAHLVAESQIEYLHRVPDREAAKFAAATYPMAVVASRRKPAASHRVRLGFVSGVTMKQQALVAPGPWILAPDHERDAIEQLRAAGTPLRDIAPPLLGVKTGADDLFVGAPMEREGAMARLRLPAGDMQVEWELLRPALRGRDVRPFGAVLRRALIWTHDAGGIPRAALPPAATAHFNAHRARLTNRSDFRGGPPWTLFRVRPEGAAWRVVWADIARKPAAVLLEKAAMPRAIPLNTCYHVHLGDRDTALVVTAVFNSTWCAVLARFTADEARGGYRRINHRTAGGFPIPPAGPATDALTSFSARAHELDNPDISALDEAVARAFGLPAEVERTLRRMAARPG